MDRWGTKVCRERIDEITDRLLCQVSEYRWTVRPPATVTLARWAMKIPAGESLVRWRCRELVLEAIEAASAAGQPATFVYPYLAKAAVGDELLYSVRSVERFYQGQADIWIVGDRPTWWARDDRFVPCPQVRGGARIDRANKLRKITKTPAIPEVFVWTQDDIYFVRPVSFDVLATRWTRGPAMTAERLDQWHPSGFGLQKKRTYQKLLADGKPLNDHAAHMPAVYEKSKLARLIDDYKLLKTPYVDDLLYLNVYADPKKPPKPVGRLMARINSRQSRASLLCRLENAWLHNHVNGEYTGPVEEYLFRTFTTKTKWEK